MGMRPTWLFNSTVDTPDEVIGHNTILESVEALGNLELVKYNFSEITELSEKNKAYLGIFKVPDSKAVLIASGHAVGCIDLNKISANDIQVKEGSLFIKLPEAEICFYKLDLDKSRIYSVEKAVYYKNEKDLIQKIYKTAEDQIKVAALNSGILEQTSNNAEIMLRPLLEQLSGKNVVFVYPLENRETIGLR
jgi:hypothetical protein